jgi:hypothetical protein
MNSNLDKFRNDLKKLITLGDTMEMDLSLCALEEEGKLPEEHKDFKDKINGTFEKDYQRWYTEAHAIIRQLIPDRLKEFEELYKGEGKRKEINSTTYNIQDWLNGTRSGNNIYSGEKYYNDFAIVSMRFRTQLAILKSSQSRFEGSLFDIKQIVQADLFDSELAAARELLKTGFLRGAGVIAGVVLEAHLSQVCRNHNVHSKKKDPTINDFNELLKSTNVLDVPQWRFIQRLGDLRNLCGHKKDREPTADEVTELISGVEKTTKTLY